MAVKPSMRFIATTSDKLDTIEVKAGQLIFCSDTRAIYLDTDVRTSYQAVITVFDEATRQAIKTPIEGFYYVRLENTLWSYFDSTWTQITGQDSSVIFVDDLPQEGDIDIIYVKGTEMYRWNESSQIYEKVGGSDLEWEQMA